MHRPAWTSAMNDRPHPSDPERPQPTPGNSPRSDGTETGSPQDAQGVLSLAQARLGYDPQADPGAPASQELEAETEPIELPCFDQIYQPPRTPPIATEHRTLEDVTVAVRSDYDPHALTMPRIRAPAPAPKAHISASDRNLVQGLIVGGLFVAVVVILVHRLVFASGRPADSGLKPESEPASAVSVLASPVPDQPPAIRTITATSAIPSQTPSSPAVTAPRAASVAAPAAPSGPQSAASSARTVPSSLPPRRKLWIE